MKAPEPLAQAIVYFSDPERATRNDRDGGDGIAVLVLVGAFGFAEGSRFGFLLFWILRLGSLKESFHGLLESLFRFRAFGVLGHVS